MPKAKSAKSSFEVMFDDRLHKMPQPAERNETREIDSSAEPKIGRPRAGKRSNAEYKQFSVLLKKTTHKEVNRILDDMEPKHDVSDLVQQLLEHWLQQHKQ